MVDNKSILGFLSGKDKFNNSGLDYLKSFIDRGGDINDLNKEINRGLSFRNMLAEGLRTIGQNAKSYNEPQGTSGQIVNGFYVPGVAVKRNPFVTMLNIINDGTKGALNSASMQQEGISQAETFRNALIDGQEQNELNRQEKERALKIQEEKNRIQEAKNKIDANKNNELTQAKIAKYKADTQRSELVSRDIDFKHDKAKQEQGAYLKRYMGAANAIYDNLSQMDESYFGVGRWNAARRLYKENIGNKNAQLYANLEQIKNNDLPAILKGIGGGNMLVDDKIIKGLLSKDSTKENNAKNIVELLEESVNKIPQKIKNAHPEELREFHNQINKLKSLYMKPQITEQSSSNTVEIDRKKLNSMMGK